MVHLLGPLPPSQENSTGSRKRRQPPAVSALARPSFYKALDGAVREVPDFSIMFLPRAEVRFTFSPSRPALTNGSCQSICSLARSGPIPDKACTAGGAAGGAPHRVLSCGPRVSRTHPALVCSRPALHALCPADPLREVRGPPGPRFRRRAGADGDALLHERPRAALRAHGVKAGLFETENEGCSGPGGRC